VTVQPATAQEPEVPEPPPYRDRLNQPRRALVAAAEVLVAAALVWLAFWLWSKAPITLTQSFSDGRPPYVSHRYFGHWMSLSILSGTVAAVLLVDAVRQTLLAARVRPPGKGRRRR
jgi:hypothetical protein